jgi:hypothetical protein
MIGRLDDSPRPIPLQQSRGRQFRQVDVVQSAPERPGATIFRRVRRERRREFAFGDGRRSIAEDVEHAPAVGRKGIR